MSKRSLYLALITVFLGIVFIDGQYSPEQQGMSVSLFQFDPKELGIYHEPKQKRKLPVRKKKNVTAKKNKTPGAKGPLSKNASESTLLNKNPKPSKDEAINHLKNVKFDGAPVNSSISLLSTNHTISSSNSTNNATKSAKEELLFYKNKTKVSIDGSEKVNSVKLTKTTPVEKTPEPVRIVQAFNETMPKSNSTKNATVTENKKGLNKTTSLLINSTNNTVNGSLSSANSTAKRRNDILAHFIPIVHGTDADKQDSFQAGSKKHKVHHMYPECYQCPKQSNYTECVKKATLLKCNEGLNNICFAKSNKGKGKKSISYEMGCTNHTHCGNAKAFPCRDGSKYCFTCCQFNKCNASPHHGDFETDEINLDELTKEKPGTTTSSTNSTASIRSFSSVSLTTVVLAGCFMTLVV